MALTARDIGKHAKPSGNMPTFGGAVLTIDEDGIGNPGVIPNPPEPTLSQAQQFALFVPKHGDQCREALGSDGDWCKYCDGTAKWHRRTLQLVSSHGNRRHSNSL